MQNTTPPSGAPLRVGIMLNAPELALWQLRMLENLEREGCCQVVVALIRHENIDESSHRSSASWSWSKRLSQTLFYRYRRMDARKFTESPDTADTHPLAAFSADLQHIELTPQTTQWSDYVSDEEVEVVKALELDVIIRLGWRIVRGDILQAAKFGVWSYHHADNRVNRGGPPGFWELYNDETCTGITLQILNDDLDDGLVIARSTTSTSRVSMHQTKSRLYWRSMVMLPRALNQLHTLGADAFFARVNQQNDTLTGYSKPLLTEKNLHWSQVLFAMGKNIARYIKHGLAFNLFEDKWVLYYKLAQSPATSLWQFTRLESPDDRYWADPHIIHRDNRFYVFVEEYMFATDRGHIAVLEMSEQGELLDTRPVLTSDTHLSYPFVFEHNGETYMLPENCATNQIKLYRATSFPDEWVLERVLIDDIHAVDATLHFDNDRWWLFANVSIFFDDQTHDELFVFSADDLLADTWRPHPLNPVVSDVNRARPGGALFEHRGKLYRPAQDCSRHYGYAVRIQQIETLNDTQYVERDAVHFKPHWSKGLKGTHTYSTVPGLTMVDAKVYRWKRSLQR